jgi:hypothetical protein
MEIRRGVTPSGVMAPQFETTIIAIVAWLVLGEVPEARNRTAVAFSGLLGNFPLAADVAAMALSNRARCRTRIVEQAGRIVEFRAGLCGTA